jgi:hypothetical protein
MKKKTRRRSWLSQRNRAKWGASAKLILQLKLWRPDKFRNFLRVTPDQFDLLYKTIKPHCKVPAINSSISIRTKLEITLRYLASGDYMVSISYMFRVSKATVSGDVISEMCLVIYEVLQPLSVHRRRMAACEQGIL